MKNWNLLLAVCLVSLLVSCKKEMNTKATYPSVLATAQRATTLAPFKEYWYEGKAEVNSYALEQVRYGEIRKGDAVLVFVTEAFSRSKQVKLDYPKGEKDEVAVMKLNALRKFNTGIYDYATMASVFTPVQLEQFPNSFKTTTSSQEWCGQTYTQFNLEEEEYQVSGFSYFESEGDETFKIAAAILEDELFTRIRLQAENLPLGEFDVIPSVLYSRLQHKPIRPTKARASIKNIENGKQYTLEYLHLDRTVKIDFETAFPHKILAWSEIDNGQRTSASLKESMKTAYWSQSSNRFEGLRDDLGLTK